ncbi:MAG: hypothetical protein OXC06_11340 [Acidimicrobiaceae bacterium]|nr:hypothetical protein [Acidimicrobiaceae bacterium]
MGYVLGLQLGGDLTAHERHRLALDTDEVNIQQELFRPYGEREEQPHSVAGLDAGLILANQFKR